MEIEDIDLIIIGGGPSGSLTGYHAARLGFQVLILEKKKFPRIKPCGGGLTLRALQYLPFPINHLVKHRDHRVLFSVGTLNRGRMIECCTPDFFSVQIIRSEFDTYLLKQAQKAGAQMKTKEVVGIEIKKDFIVTTPNRIYRSRYLVAADGSNGISKKLLGMVKNSHQGAALEGDIFLKDYKKGKLADVEFYFNAYQSSYAWIFPKNAKGTMINVGVFTYDGKKIKLSRQALYRFVQDRLGLKADTLQNLRGYPLNFDYKVKTPHPNLILVGDAAGYPEPLWGEGLHHALKSAHLAGLSLKQVITQGGSFRDIYNHHCREIFADLRFCHYLSKKFNQKPRIGNLFIRFPFLKWFFIRLMVSGRPTYHILNRFFTILFWKPSQQKAVGKINDHLLY